jgi:hypothetical protein
VGMGFSPRLLIWALPAILVVGVVATLFAAIRSRPGVQEGFRVIPRLYCVDAVSLGCHAVTASLVMFCWFIMLPWGEFFLQPVAPFWLLLCGFAFGWLLVAGLTTLATTLALRWFFRAAGILTAEQAKYYPLRANKLRFDPWPACWQEAWPQNTLGVK